MRGAPQVEFSATIRKISAHLFADALASSSSPGSRDPRPIQTKPSPMPAHHGSRSDQDERLLPPEPERSQGDPEQPVQGSQSAVRSLGVQG